MMVDLGWQKLTTLPPWADSNDELAKINALTSACCQFLLMCMMTEVGGMGGHRGVAYKIKLLHNITISFGKQVYMTSAA